MLLHDSYNSAQEVLTVSILLGVMTALNFKCARAIMVNSKNRGIEAKTRLTNRLHTALSRHRGIVGFLMIGLGCGFFTFSMLAWQGFNLVERGSIVPWINFRTEAEFASIYWWNYVVLALTIVSLAVAVLGFAIYVFVQDPPGDDKAPAVSNTSHR